MANDPYDSESRPSAYRSGGFRLLAILVAAVVIGERAINLTLSSFGLHMGPVYGVVGALILTGILFPILYYAVFKDVLEKNRLLASTEGRLRAAHNWLEQCITERTREIHTANEQLERAVLHLKHHKQEMIGLAEMGHLLQACSTVEEACTVIKAHLHRILPAMSGALYINDPPHARLQKVTALGKGVDFEAVIEPATCWAFRHGRPHQVDGLNPATTCAHRNYDKSDWHVCLPMLAQGETLGLLCLQAQRSVVEQISDEGRLSDERMQFYVMIADSLALALVNLRLREELQQQAIRDPLTGLYNRRLFDDALERELDRAIRSAKPLSLVMLDVDDFKRFNDTYGHGGGDAVLKEVAGQLVRLLLEADTAYRLGGDEFALILPGACAREAARCVDRLRSEVEGASGMRCGNAFGRVRLSAGIAEYPSHAGGKSALISAADNALYKSKRAAPAPETADEEHEDKPPLTVITQRERVS